MPGDITATVSYNKVVIQFSYTFLTASQHDLRGCCFVAGIYVIVTLSDIW
jgi:hypothetical protein